MTKKWFYGFLLFLKEKWKDILFIVISMLLVISGVAIYKYFNEKDISNMSKDENIEILYQDALYNSTGIWTNTDYNFNISQVDDYTNRDDMLDNNMIDSGVLNIKRLNLTNLKNSLLSFNNNTYSINLNDLMLSLKYNIDYYWTPPLEEYLNIYVSFNNNSTINTFGFRNLSPFVHLLCYDNLSVTNSVSIPLTFDYNYLDIYYYSVLYDRDTNEFFNSYESMSINDSVNNVYYQKTINNLNNEYNRLITQYNNLNNDYNTLSNNYDILDNNYNNLLDQYNILLNATEYSFSELFWSISAVPFGVLTSTFNVDVLGINLASIITGLFTTLLLIWILKKFLK